MLQVWVAIRVLGPGLLESAYRACLSYELRKRAFNVIEEKPIPLFYDKIHLECGFRIDLLVNNQIVVELKAKSKVHPVDKAQILSHLRLMNLRFGLLINFHEEKLIDGVHRIVNGLRKVTELYHFSRVLCDSVFQ